MRLGWKAGAGTASDGGALRAVSVAWGRIWLLVGAACDGEHGGTRHGGSGKMVHEKNLRNVSKKVVEIQNARYVEPGFISSRTELDYQQKTPIFPAL